MPWVDELRFMNFEAEELGFKHVAVWDELLFNLSLLVLSWKANTFGVKLGVTV